MPQTILDFANLTEAEIEAGSPLNWGSGDEFEAGHQFSLPPDNLFEPADLKPLLRWTEAVIPFHGGRPLPWEDYRWRELMESVTAYSARLQVLADDWPSTDGLAIRWGDSRLAVLLDIWRRQARSRRYPGLADDEAEARRLLAAAPGLRLQHRPTRQLPSQLRETTLMTSLWAIHGAHVAVVTPAGVSDFHVIPKLLGNRGVDSEDPVENPRGYSDFHPATYHDGHASIMSWTLDRPADFDRFCQIGGVPQALYFEIGDYWLAWHGTSLIPANRRIASHLSTAQR